jgi:hypothetical protein
MEIPCARWNTNELIKLLTKTLLYGILQPKEGFFGRAKVKSSPSFRGAIAVFLLLGIQLITSRHLVYSSDAFST